MKHYVWNHEARKWDPISKAEHTMLASSGGAFRLKTVNGRSNGPKSRSRKSPNRAVREQKDNF